VAGISPRTPPRELTAYPNTQRMWGRFAVEWGEIRGKRTERWEGRERKKGNGKRAGSL